MSHIINFKCVICLLICYTVFAKQLIMRSIRQHCYYTIDPRKPIFQNFCIGIWLRHADTIICSNVFERSSQTHIQLRHDVIPGSGRPTHLLALSYCRPTSSSLAAAATTTENYTAVVRFVPQLRRSSTLPYSRSTAWSQTCAN